VYVSRAAAPAADWKSRIVRFLAPGQSNASARVGNAPSAEPEQKGSFKQKARSSPTPGASPSCADGSAGGGGGSSSAGAGAAAPAVDPRPRTAPGTWMSGGGGADSSAADVTAAMRQFSLGQPFSLEPATQSGAMSDASSESSVTPTAPFAHEFGFMPIPGSPATAPTRPKSKDAKGRSKVERTVSHEG
jgi:hypothetical protein